MAFKEFHNRSLPFLCTFFSTFPPPELMLWLGETACLPQLQCLLLPPYLYFIVEYCLYFRRLTQIWLILQGRGCFMNYSLCHFLLHTLLLSLLHVLCLHGHSHRGNMYFSHWVKHPGVSFCFTFKSTTLSSTFILFDWHLLAKSVDCLKQLPGNIILKKAVHLLKTLGVNLFLNTLSFKDTN